MSLDINRALYKHDFGQKITTDIKGVGVDRAFLAHYHIAAAAAVAADADGILPLTPLGADAKTVKAGFTQPAVPRNVTVVAGTTGVTGNVEVSGTNFADEAIKETIALGATSTTPNPGNKAFKTITEVKLPARTNSPVKQKAKTEVLTAVTSPGTVVVKVVGAALAEPVLVNVAVTAEDNTVAEVAAKIAAALLGDDTVSDAYTASADGEYVYLEANVEAPQDETLALTVEDAGDTGVTLDTTDADGGAKGVTDEISIGWGDKFGLPYKLYADELVILKLVNKAVEVNQGTVTANALLEENTYDPTDTSLGVDIDLYIIV
jgi:hypothetical protein